MARPRCNLLLLLQVLVWVSGSLACFCERYPWSSWSACTRTCNYGTQQRYRYFNRDEYYWRSSCNILCSGTDTRGCNEVACPINCILTEFGPWSVCSPCAKKQLRTRSVARPSQFGGSLCSVDLTEERPCYPSTECKLAPINCRDKFQCDNGRCINSTLTCNRQDDCRDNSDERDCGDFTIVCPAEKRVAPGADLVGNGFDAMAEEPRGAVLDNMFMGGICNLKRPESTTLYHRVPHNFAAFEIKAGVPDDFSINPQPLKSEQISVKMSSSSDTGPSGFGFGLNLLIVGFKIGSNFHKTYKQAFESSKNTNSYFIRVNKILPVSTFKMRASDDLVLSVPFLQFLHALPLDYNYALYRDIFQRFGTHYYSRGTLGGHYDLLYQYSGAYVTASGETIETIKNCLSQEESVNVLVYTQHSSANRCTNTKTTREYQEEVDGSWSCWGSWSGCGAAMRRHRTRRCDNPAPLRGGQPCYGPARQEDPCSISIFRKQDTCDSDDDFIEEWSEEGLPAEGCQRPKTPANSYARKAKKLYAYGDDEEFQCFTGFELEGFQYINCLPDGTWSKPRGSCIRMVCFPPEVRDGMTLSPSKEDYRIGQSLRIECTAAGLVLNTRGLYSCSSSLTWEPPIPADLRCVDENPFTPDGQCRPGQVLQGSECVCIQRESCLSFQEGLCILNVDVGVTVSMSPCSFHAGLCHGDPLFFVSDGPCGEVDEAKLDWAKFRAKMASKSPVQVPCGHDTCYEWETCSASKKCECKAARGCPRRDENMSCLRLTKTQRLRSMNLCTMAALKCASYAFEILNEGLCESR